MNYKIACILNTGIPLTDEMSTYLLQLAYHIYNEGKSRKNFKTETIAGSISTQGKSVRIGGLAGIEFNSILETDDGRSDTAFFVSHKTLESDLSEILDSGQWITL